jgi:hypothetical protein
VPGSDVMETIRSVKESGFGDTGAPDMATARFDRLMKQSNGGSGPA